ECAPCPPAPDGSAESVLSALQIDEMTERVRRKGVQDQQREKRALQQQDLAPTHNSRENYDTRQDFGCAEKKFRRMSLVVSPVRESSAGLNGTLPGTFIGLPYQR